MKNIAIRNSLWAAFALYTACMLYMMLFRRLEDGGYSFLTEPDYLSALPRHFQLIPFRTILMYARTFSWFSLSDTAFVNLGGNIILFIPIGLFLPALFPKQRRFPVLLLTTAAAISAVELVQAFTLLGTCDIDDLILNTLGACIGSVLYKAGCTVFRKKDE